MYIANVKMDIMVTGDYLEKGQLISDEKAEKLLKNNPKLNLTKQKDGKTKKKD